MLGQRAKNCQQRKNNIDGITTLDKLYGNLSVSRDTSELEETSGQSVVNPQLSFDPFPSGIYRINSRKRICLQFMSVVIHQLTIFYALWSYPWQERNREQTRNFKVRGRNSLASERIAALKAASSPRALTGDANLEEGVILPSRSTHQRVESDTEKSETVPRTTSNFTGRNNSMTGVTQRGMEPSGSTPPRHGTGHGTTRVNPNNVESEIGPRTKRGSASAVSATNDTSTNSAISRTIGQHSEMMSKVTLNPNDSPSLGRPVQEDLARRKKNHHRCQYLLRLHGSMRKVLYLPPMFVHEQIHHRESLQRKLRVHRP